MSDDGSDFGSFGSLQYSPGTVKDVGPCQKLLLAPKLAPALRHSSLFLFSGENKARIFLYNIVRHRAFESLIIFIIVCNCVFLALGDPTQVEDPEYQVVAEYIFTAIFTVEMMMKIFGLGFFWHSGSYLRSPWNVLDFFIVLLSYLTFVPNVGNYTALRAFRVLRPLRSMNAIPGLKAIVSGLLHSIVGLGPVYLLLMFLFGIFGILGVQIMKGAYRRRCVHTLTGEVFEDLFCKYDGRPDGEQQYETWLGYTCPSPDMKCLAQPTNPFHGYLHFDNIGAACLVLFTLITFEDWTGHLVIFYDIVGQPMIIYMFVFIMMGSYFMTNLALAVINEKFVEAQEEANVAERANQLLAAEEARKSLISGTNLRSGFTLTSHHPDESLEGGMGGEEPEPGDLDVGEGEEAGYESSAHSCLSTLTMVRDVVHLFTEGYERPQPIPMTVEADVEQKAIWLADQQAVASDAKTPPFQYFIIFCIIVNTAFLGSQHHHEPQWVTDMNNVGNIVLTVIFGLEMSIKIFGMGPLGYWSDAFNVVDGLVVIISIVELALAGSATVSVFRTLRLLRVLKFFKSVPSLRKIVRVMLSAVKSTGYLNAIMLLYIFIAALMGMQFFGGKMKKLETPDEPIRTQFDNFYWSVLAVFQILTRDEWIDVMINASRATHPMALFFFIALVLIGDFLILNLFLAILISAFEADRDTDDSEYDDFSDGLSSSSPSSSFTSNIQMLRRAKTDFLFGLNVKAHDVIRIGAPMAQQIRVAERLKRSHSLIGFRSRVVLRQPMGNNCLEDDGAGGGHGNELTAANLGARVDPKEQEMCPDGEEGKSGVVRFTQAEDDGAAIDPLDTSHLAEDAHFGRMEQQETIDVSGRKVSFFGESDAGLDRQCTFDSIQCDVCQQLQQQPLPTPPLIPSVTQETLHQRMCDAMAVRVAKEKVMTKLASYVDTQLENDERATQMKVETLIGQAWSSGLLLSTTVDDLVMGVKTHAEIWERTLAALEKERKVIDLRIGEEQVGRCLIAYVASSTPKDHQTNGGWAMGIFGPTNKLRVLLSETVQHPWWDHIILVCIIVSSALLAFDNPREDQTSTKYFVLDTLDAVFTFIFVVEMCFKVVAYGFVHHQGSYLRSGWNVLDFVIVIVSIVSFAGREGQGSGAPDIGWLKVLRTLRALRPLRVITKNRGLKIVVVTLFQSIKGIANVALISLLNYLIFGILGVTFFSGKLYYCTDPSIRYRNDCIGNFTATEDDFGIITNTTEARRWVVFPHNFNHLGSSMLTLVEVSSMEWWVPVMYNSIDAVSYDEVPQRNHRPIFGLFYVVFIVVASFFLLNMFVGVVISNFNQAKTAMDGLSMLDEDQKTWVETQRLMLNFRPKPLVTHAGTKWSKRAFTIASSTKFEVFIAGCILGNVVVLGMDYHGASANYDMGLTICNNIFAGIFILEAALKLVGFRRSYFYDGWNQFDFFLVVISVIGFILSYAVPGGLGVDVGVLLVLRTFRIMRILRLVRQAKRVRLLLETLWFALPSLANIGGFMFLLFFIYSILGMQLFYAVNSGVKIDDKYTNFHNFWNSMGLLLRFMTVTDWNMAMHDCMVRPPDCVSTGPNANCGSTLAPLYFISFLLLAAFVLTNLFIAIILDNFATTMKLDASQGSEVNITDLQKFIELWPQYDPTASMTIPTHRLHNMLARLGPPLGLAHVGSKVELLRMTGQYRVPEHGGYIHFVETLIPIARSSMGVQCSLREIREHEEQWRQNFDELAELPVLRYRYQVITIQLYFASTFLQSAHRRRMAYRRVERIRLEKRNTIARYLEMHRKAGAHTTLPTITARPRSLSQVSTSSVSTSSLVAPPVMQRTAEPLTMDRPRSLNGRSGSSSDGWPSAASLAAGRGSPPGGRPRRATVTGERASPQIVIQPTMPESPRSMGSASNSFGSVNPLTGFARLTAGGGGGSGVDETTGNQPVPRLPGTPTRIGFASSSSSDDASSPTPPPAPSFLNSDGGEDTTAASTPSSRAESRTP